MFCGIKETNQQNQRSQFTVDPLKSVDFAFPRGSVVDRFHESVVIGFPLTGFFFFFFFFHKSKSCTRGHPVFLSDLVS